MAVSLSLRTGLLSLLLLGSLLPGSPAVAATSVEAKALFQGAALLRINGQQKLLRVGQTGPGGVLLREANSRYAVVEVDGESRRLSLTADVHRNFTPVEKRSVSIGRDERGTYRVTGSINGQPMPFIVDTGATVVAINSGEARRLGLDYKRDGAPGIVNTASGQAPAFQVQFERVKVGEIEVRNVRGLVLEGPHPPTALLGRSYLNEVNMVEQNGVLELQAKY